MIKRWFTGLLGMICGMLLVFIATTSGTVKAQSTTCELVNNQDQMPVYFAPVNAPSQLKDILPQGTPYTMIGTSNGFFWITYGEGEYGWIDFHMRINGICDAFQPTDSDNSNDIPLTEFPTLCFYSISETLMGYTDSSLTQQHPGFGLYDPGTYAVVSITDDAIELEGATDMSGGFVEANRGLLTGHCSGTRQLATALDNARVWTQPDATAGDVITTLPIGAQVGVLSDPIVGNVQTDVVGDWVQVVRGDVVGWVWVERLTFGRTFTTAQAADAQAVVGDNTRIWTQPDAKQGSILTALPAGTQVAITGDPVTGFIQLDTDLEGDWYPIQVGGTTGWIYEGRLTFLGE